MKTNIILVLISTITLMVSLASCNEQPTPKPEGFFRIHLPEKNYKPFVSKCGYKFEIPQYAKVDYYAGSGMDTCWFNLTFPRLNAKIHFTHLYIDNNLRKFTEDSYKFAYKHESMASNITTTPYHAKEKNTSGLIYDLEGDVASTLQFYITDSTTNFLRGALYFNNHPNADSLSSVIEFLREDMIHIYETITWDHE